MQRRQHGRVTGASGQGCFQVVDGLAQPRRLGLLVQVIHELGRLTGGSLARDQRAQIGGQVRGRAQIQEVEAPVEQCGRGRCRDREIAGQVARPQGTGWPRRRILDLWTRPGPELLEDRDFVDSRSGTLGGCIAWVVGLGRFDGPAPGIALGVLGLYSAGHPAGPPRAAPGAAGPPGGGP